MVNHVFHMQYAVEYYHITFTLQRVYCYRARGCTDKAMGLLLVNPSFTHCVIPQLNYHTHGHLSLPNLLISLAPLFHQDMHFIITDYVVVIKLWQYSSLVCNQIQPLLVTMWCILWIRVIVDTQRCHPGIPELNPTCMWKDKYDISTFHNHWTWSLCIYLKVKNKMIIVWAWQW